MARRSCSCWPKRSTHTASTVYWVLRYFAYVCVAVVRSLPRLGRGRTFSILACWREGTYAVRPLLLTPSVMLPLPCVKPAYLVQNAWSLVNVFISEVAETAIKLPSLPHSREDTQIGKIHSDEPTAPSSVIVLTNVSHKNIHCLLFAQLTDEKLLKFAKIAWQSTFYCCCCLTTCHLNLYVM